MNPLDHFPADWKTPVTVTRGGRDRKGNPLPTTTHQVDDCLVGWRSTVDPVDRADLSSDTAVIAARVGSDFADRDLITIPDGPWPSGSWTVNGAPKPTPLGVEIQIRRGV